MWSKSGSERESNFEERGGGGTRAALAPGLRPAQAGQKASLRLREDQLAARMRRGGYRVLGVAPGAPHTVDDAHVSVGVTTLESQAATSFTADPAALGPPVRRRRSSAPASAAGSAAKRRILAVRLAHGTVTWTISP